MKKLILTLTITLMSLMSFAQSVTFTQGECDTTITAVLGIDTANTIHIKNNEEFSVELSSVLAFQIRSKDSTDRPYYQNDTILEGFTFNIISNGTYYLVYQNSDYKYYIKLIVGDQTECEYQAHLGVKDIVVEDIELVVYPNPVTDIVNVKFDSRVALPVELYTLSGQLLETNVDTFEGMNEVTLNMSDLAPGMYLVKVGNVTKKFVVE